jgi:flagellar hook-basal body complex protein FliE
MVDSLNNLSNLAALTSAAGNAGAVKPGQTVPTDAASGASPTSFKDVLMQNLSEVNKLQQDADSTLENYVTGKSGNLGEVISASQKASLAFSMLVQIRNKLQDAYDEVKNLRV